MMMLSQTLLVWTLVLLCSSAFAAIRSERRDPYEAQRDADKPISEPRSAPVASAGHLPSSKFTSREAMKLEQVVFGTDVSSFQPLSQCPMPIELAWTNKLDSGIYATPIIDQFTKDGSKQILVSAFQKQLSMVDSDGHDMPEWPFTIDDTYFHASPLVVELHGTPMIVWISVNGEIYFLRYDDGRGPLLADDVQHIPRLKVRTKWYANLEYNKELRTGVKSAGKQQPPAAGAGAAGNSTAAGRKLLQADEGHDGAGADDSQQDNHQQQQDQDHGDATDSDEADAGGNDDGAGDPYADEADADGFDENTDDVDMAELNDMLQDPDDLSETHDDGESTATDDDQHPDDAHAGSGSGSGNAGDHARGESRSSNKADEAVGGIAATKTRPLEDSDWLDQLGDGLTDEGKDSLKLFTDTEDNMYDDTSRGHVDHVERYDDDGFAHLQDDKEVWAKELKEEHAPAPEGYVLVDAHVMATPVVADVDGDGTPNVVIAVSYFFDEEDYNNNPKNRARLGTDVDIRKYVAGGIVVLDLVTRNILWSEHLDLTTDETDLRAFIYDSPTVVDLDADGQLEVIVATSLGFVYVLDGKTGHVLPNFPLIMAEIQGQVAVEDVNGDGHLEMIAADSKGNVMCFTKAGKEVWETQISGFASQGATFGDVDGDGVLDVVLATVTGHIWALKGTDGTVLPHFPVKTNGRILAPVLLVNLDAHVPSYMARQVLIEKRRLARKLKDKNDTKALEDEKKELKMSATAAIGADTIIPSSAMPEIMKNVMKHKPGLHLVVPSFDGHVYIIDGRSGCTNKIDIGEKSYSMVLADDVLGRQKMDLLVTTMNGNLFLFSTQSPYNALKAWPSQTHRMNGFTARDKFHGIYVTAHSRQARDVLGTSFPLEFVIVDRRHKLNAEERRKASSLRAKSSGAGGEDKTTAPPARYTVTVSLGSTEVFRKEYTEPGSYVEEISCPDLPIETLVRVQMYNEHKQYFSDSFSMAFNLSYYRTLKWLLVAPFLVMSTVLIVVKTLKPSLPL